MKISLRNILNGLFIGLLLFVVAPFIWCSFGSPFLPWDIRNALSSPETVELFSLESGNEKLFPQSELDRPRVYNFPNLGSTVLNPADSSIVTNWLWYRLVWYDSPLSLRTVEFGCFWPHHMVRITSQGHVYDFVICFNCGNAQVYRDGIWKYQFGWTGDRSAFNKILINAHVPLPQTQPE